MVIVLFSLRLEESATDPSGLAGVKNETQEFLHPSEAACACLMSWTGTRRQRVHFVLVGAFLCSVCVWPSGRLSDGPSFGWPLLHPGRRPVGTKGPSRAGQEKGFVDSCHTRLLLLLYLLLPYFTCNILDPHVTAADSYSSISHSTQQGEETCTYITIGIIAAMQ